MALPTELKTLAIPEILSKYPETEDIFRRYGLNHYARTETAKYENLQASALVHGVDLESLTTALAQAIKH